MAYSTAQRTRLLELVPADGPAPAPVALAAFPLLPRPAPPTIKRHDLPASLPAARHIYLVDKAAAAGQPRAVQLVMTTADGSVLVYGVDSGAVEHTFPGAALAASHPLTARAVARARLAVQQATPTVTATALSATTRLIALAAQHQVRTR